MVRAIIGHLDADDVMGLCLVSRETCYRLYAWAKWAVEWKLRYRLYCMRPIVPGAERYTRDYLGVPRVMSRTCRGCGKHTYRKLLHARVPVCEKCTKDPRRRMWMLPLSELSYYMCPTWMREFLRGSIYIHSGRRGELVFVEDFVSFTQSTRCAVQDVLGFGK